MGHFKSFIFLDIKITKNSLGQAIDASLHERKPTDERKKCFDLQVPVKSNDDDIFQLSEMSTIKKKLITEIRYVASVRTFFFLSFKTVFSDY